MNTIAMRFAENFAPACGTIRAHEEVINELGFVYYGKLGNSLSNKKIEELLSLENPKILLIRSGGVERYWAYIQHIQKETPELQYIPSYYRDKSKDFKCWFKIVKFETATKDIMSKCIVTSSGNTLSEASKRSMNSSFYITYKE